MKAKFDRPTRETIAIGLARLTGKPVLVSVVDYVYNLIKEVEEKEHNKYKQKVFMIRHKDTPEFKAKKHEYNKNYVLKHNSNKLSKK